MRFSACNDAEQAQRLSTRDSLLSSRHIHIRCRASCCVIMHDTFPFLEEDAQNRARSGTSPPVKSGGPRRPDGLARRQQDAPLDFPVIARGVCMNKRVCFPAATNRWPPTNKIPELNVDGSDGSIARDGASTGSRRQIVCGLIGWLPDCLPGCPYSLL